MVLVRLPLVRADAAPRITLVKLALWTAALLSIMSTASVAQTQQAQPAPAAASEPAAPPKAPENPGLLGEIGKLLTAPAALLPSMKPAEPSSEPAPAPVPPTPAKEAPAAGSRLVPGIVTGRELCPRSENGAPDCKTGSDRLCRGKGYTAGKSLDTDAAFECSTKPLQRRGKLCDTETYVTRAFCQ